MSLSHNGFYHNSLIAKDEGLVINEKVITELQGACRPCQSCKLMAFSFQETIAASIEDNNKCIVAFFDVAKAFDTMWMEGLFKHMYIHLVLKERHCCYCIDDILMLIVRIYREMFQTDISTPRGAHLMVRNGSWHLPGNPKLVCHPARLLKEWGCTVDLSMDTLHLKYPLVLFGSEGSALTLSLFLFFHLE